jgi:hypothetical protein
MKSKWNATVIAVEVTSLNEFITYPLKNELRRRKVFGYTFIELKPRDKKENRIKALMPLYRLGLIYHNPLVCDKLEDQLLHFPASKLLDVMDAFAYIAELFTIGEQFFLPNYSLMDENPLPEETKSLYVDDCGEEFTLDDMRYLV